MPNKKHCTIPPLGWECTRKPGHEGPCAATKKKPIVVSISVERKAERVCFVTDDDGHWYMIPASKKGAFELWVGAGPYWDGYEGEDFEDHALGMHPSNFSFENVKEI